MCFSSMRGLQLHVLSLIAGSSGALSTGAPGGDVAMLPLVATRDLNPGIDAALAKVRRLELVGRAALACGGCHLCLLCLLRLMCTARTNATSTTTNATTTPNWSADSQASKSKRDCSEAARAGGTCCPAPSPKQ